jgi:hypothetical protein
VFLFDNDGSPLDYGGRSRDILRVSPMRKDLMECRTDCQPKRKYRKPKRIKVEDEPKSKIQRAAVIPQILAQSEAHDWWVYSLCIAAVLYNLINLNFTKAQYTHHVLGLMIRTLYG